MNRLNKLKNQNSAPVSSEGPALKEIFNENTFPLLVQPG
jgi:hypothetical protein